MSLDFDGVNDVITLATVTLGSTRTCSAWVFPDTLGSGSNGNVFGHDTKTGGLDINATAKFRFSSDRGTNGVWIMTSNLTTLAEWHFICVTYDATSTSNDPIMYVTDGGVLTTLTVGSGLTESSTPAGAESDDGGTWCVGASRTGGQDAWDGKIGEHAVWTRILTPAEVTAVWLNGVQASPGAYLYWPMDRVGTAQANDYSGNARHGTITGAVEGENPPVRPAGRRG